MATMQQLETALVNADRAGDTNAARMLAQEIQRYRQAGVTDADPNEGMNFAQKALVGIGRSADKTGRGIAELALRGADMLGIDAAGRKADELQATGQQNTDLWKQNATGVMKGSELVGDIAQFAVPATKIGGATRAASLGQRALAQSAGAMGLDAVQQQGEGQQGIDARRTALTGAFAGGAELAAPLVSRMVGAVARKLKGNEGVLERGRVVAETFEIDPAKVAAEKGIKTEEVLNDLAKQYDEMKGGLTKDAAILENDFGMKLLKGQRLGDADVMAKEELIEQVGGRTGKQIRQVRDSQWNRMNELRGELSGGITSPGEAARGIRESVLKARGGAKAEADAAWKLADQGNLQATGSLLDDFNTRTQAALSDVAFDQNNAPAATSAIKKVQETLKPKTTKTTVLGPDGNPVTGSEPVDYRKIELARKILTNAAGNAKSTDKLVAGRALNAFDKSIAGLTEDTLVQGSPDDIANMLKAVSKSRDFFNRFLSTKAKSRDSGMIQKIVDEQNEDVLAKILIGGSQASNDVASSTAIAIKRAIGNKTAGNAELQKEALKNLEGAVVYNALTASGDKPFSYGVLQNNIKNMLNKPALRKHVLSNETATKLDRLATGLNALIKPAHMAKSSGTAERSLRYVLSLMDSTGVLQPIASVIRKAASSGAASRAVNSPIVPQGTAPLLPAAAATQSNNR